MVPENGLPTLEEVAAQFMKEGTADPVTEPDTVTHTKVDPDGEPAKKEPIPSNEDPADLKPSLEDEADRIEKEAQADAEAKKPVKRDPAAARFAALAKRDREVRQRAQEAEQRQAAIEARERAIQERESRLAAAKKHPLDLLKEHGYTYQDATQAVLGGYTPKEPDPTDAKLDERLSPMAAEFAEMKKTLAERDAVLSELQRRAVESAQREVRQSIETAAVESGCEFITKIGDEAYVLVQDVISEHYKKYKRILNYSEACGRVEKYYEDRFEKLASAPKVQSRLAPTTEKNPKAPSSKTPVNPPAKESPKTLTQSLSSGGNRAKIDVDKLNKHEAIEYLTTQLRFID